MGNNISRKIEEISDTRAEVVAAGPRPLLE